MAVNSCSEFRIAIAIATSAMAAAGVAADYPERPVRAIVPFATGSSNDTMARLISPLLSQALGQPVVIFNKPGADGRIGLEFLAKATPDGYSILFSGGAVALNPALRREMPYDPARDIQPVAQLGKGTYVIGVTARSAVRSIADLINFAKQNPGKLNGAAGGNATRMSIVLFQVRTGTRIEVIPYGGTGQAAAAVASGESDLVIMSPSSVLPHIASGRIRALAVAGDRRLPALADVPTTREAGLPGYVAFNIAGVYATGGTPSAIVRRLNAEINKIVGSSRVSAHLVSIGLDPVVLSADEFTRQYREELKTWKDVVTKAKLPLED
jgi:tripartite-type tricarboxylate transporter receptor subunit TctC